MSSKTTPEQRFVAAPQATLEHEQFRISWPAGGLPLALDRAAASMLDCFDEPLAASELAADLTAALDMEPGLARRTASDLTQTLLRSGQVIPEGMTPMPASYLSYPPSASP